MGRTADYSNERCSLAGTLEIIGDPWTLLIIRDAFFGVRRFEQWQASLGVARNVLASRLRILTQHGVMAKETYSTRPLRQEYVLTPKGRDLFPILMAMRDWGDQHVYAGDRKPRVYTHIACGQTFKPKIVCACCNDGVSKMRELTIERDHEVPTVGEMLEKALA